MSFDQTIVIVLLTVLISLFLSYLFIIRKFNNYINEHRYKIDSYIYKQMNHPSKLDDTDETKSNN